MVCGLFTTVPIVEVVDPFWSITASNGDEHQKVGNDYNEQNECNWNAHDDCNDVIDDEANLTEKIYEEIFHRAKVLK